MTTRYNSNYSGSQIDAVIALITDDSGNLSITGSLLGTASYADQAMSSSYTLNAESASYALSASYEINYETSSSYADYAVSASSAGNAYWTESLAGLISRESDVEITGSLNVNGSLEVVGGITGSGNLRISGDTKLSDLNVVGNITASNIEISGSTGATTYIQGKLRDFNPYGNGPHLEIKSADGVDGFQSARLGGDLILRAGTGVGGGGNVYIYAGNKGSGISEKQIILVGNITGSNLQMSGDVNITGSLNISGSTEIISGSSVILSSPDGTRWALTVSDTGVVSASAA